MVNWVLKHAVFGDKPWAVQAEALRRCGGRKRFGYFMEQGLGKTALTFNDYLIDDDVDLCIVAAPQSFKMDWVMTPDEWGWDVQTGMWPKTPLPFDWEGGLFSINHEALRASAGRDLLELFKKRRCMFVFDESKAISNPTSDVTKATMLLGKYATKVRLLNGTPMTEVVMDLYPQLRMLGEYEGWSPYSFRNRYAEMGGFMGKKIVGLRKDTMNELAERIDRCAFRALKKDWRKDLPPRVMTSVQLIMTDKQREHYLTMLEEFYIAVENDEVTAEMVLTQMGKLRQVTSGFVKKEDSIHWLVKPNENPKLRATLDLLESGASSSKFIVVHVYKATGHLITDVLRKEGYEPAAINGDMSPEEIIRDKHRFNNDPACRVIVCQERAAHRGHTLLGQAGKDRCSKMVYFENEFSFYQRAQMNDRNHRGAQDEVCHIFDLVASPIDTKTISALTFKQASADFVDEIVAEVRSRRWAK